MTITNIVTAPISANRITKTRPLHQYDYGQVLKIVGVDLPELYSVHFSNVLMDGDAIVEAGNADGVPIPDALLETGLTVYAWLYLHTGDSDGETICTVIIPVIKRSKPTDEGHDPEKVDTLDRAITALDGAVEAAQAAQQAAEEAAQQAQSIIDALLARVTELESQLATYNTVKLCNSTAPKSGGVNGVSFSWTGNYRCTVSGTPQSNAESDYFAYSDDLAADGIETGKSYFLRFNSTGGKVYLRVTYWTLSDSGELVPHSGNYKEEATYFLPRTAVAFGLSLYVYSSSSYVSDNVTVGLYSAAPSNIDLYNMIKALKSSSGGSSGGIIISG